MSKVKKDLENALHAAMLKSAIDVRNAVVVKLSGARTGKMYRVPATARMYRASAAGEPPAQRLSHYLEYGTAKMKPRPHLKPAFLECKDKIQKHFEGLI
jgi:hypothetical protein